MISITKRHRTIYLVLLLVITGCFDTKKMKMMKLSKSVLSEIPSEMQMSINLYTSYSIFYNLSKSDDDKFKTSSRLYQKAFFFDEDQNLINETEKIIIPQLNNTVIVRNYSVLSDSVECYSLNLRTNKRLLISKIEFDSLMKLFKPMYFRKIELE